MYDSIGSRGIDLKGEKVTGHQDDARLVN